MILVVQHKENGKVFEAQQQQDGTYVLKECRTEKVSVVKESTFKRYYKLYEERQPVEKKYDWRKYYHPYQKNTSPLWDAVIEGNKLLVRNNNKEIIMTVVKSGKKYKIIQHSTNCKRYFDEDKICGHICINQDINTCKKLRQAVADFINGGGSKNDKKAIQKNVRNNSKNLQ